MTTVLLSDVLEMIQNNLIAALKMYLKIHVLFFCCVLACIGFKARTYQSTELQNTSLIINH